MIVIRKYTNRRLYDTNRSRYVNLEDIAKMIRSGEEISVADVETGADLTREILMQIVLETQRGHELFPVGMLRRIIRAGGEEPAQLLLRTQLVSGLELLSAQMDRLEAMFQPFQRPAAPQTTPAPAATPAPERDPETAELEARLAALEARLRR